LPFAFADRATGSSLSRPPRNTQVVPEFLSWASAPLQRLPKHRAAALNPRFSESSTTGMSRTQTSSASLEVSNPSASSRAEQRLELAGFASPNRQRLQVLTTSWRLHPLRACRPCFMPDPLLGSPSRAFSSRVAVRRFQRLSPRGVITPSGFYSARESATRFSGLDWNRAHSSPGSFPLQGFHSFYAGLVFTSPPLL
jgi:hypothetical protein